MDEIQVPEIIHTDAQDMKLRHLVYRPVPFVFEYLSDMQKFETVHPVISKIKSLGGNNYQISEKLKFGFIPSTFSYTATVEGDLNKGTVIMNALVMRIVKINIVFNLQAEGENTLVDETITFYSIFQIPHSYEGV